MPKIASIKDASPETKKKVDTLIEKALIDEPSPSKRDRTSTVTGTLIKKLDEEAILSKVTTSELTRYVKARRLLIDKQGYQHVGEPRKPPSPPKPSSSRTKTPIPKAKIKSTNKESTDVEGSGPRIYEMGEYFDSNEQGEKVFIIVPLLWANGIRIAVNAEDRSLVTVSFNDAIADVDWNQFLTGQLLEGVNKLLFNHQSRIISFEVKLPFAVKTEYVHKVIKKSSCRCPELVVAVFSKYDTEREDTGFIDLGE